MRLLQRLPQLRDLLAVLVLQPGDLGRQRGHDVVAAVALGDHRPRGRAVGSPLVLNSRPQIRVLVEEVLRDTGLPLDCLEGHRLARWVWCQRRAPTAVSYRLAFIVAVVRVARGCVYGLVLVDGLHL